VSLFLAVIRLVVRNIVRGGVCRSFAPDGGAGSGAATNNLYINGAYADGDWNYR
jgi:hypothetical protein